MERIGIYGGTFNPPQSEQISDIKQVMKRRKLSALYLMPIFDRPEEGSPTPGQIGDMLCLAADEIPNCHTLPGFAGKSVNPAMADAGEALRKQNPDIEVVLILDSGMAEDLNLPSDMEILDEEKRSISSENAHRLRDFAAPGAITTEKIAEYIRTKHLYGCSPDYRNLPMERLEKIVVSLLNPNRVNHVLGCRDTAVRLAKKWGADEINASRAGILHDITKALDGPLQLTLCREYGILLDAFSAKNPKTLHALTGSLVAEQVFGENAEVVSAIRHHTTGKADMNLLEKIVYVADYMEPNRAFPGVEKLRELAFLDLDAALQLGLTMTIDLLKRQGREISRESLEALAWLSRKQPSL